MFSSAFLQLVRAPQNSRFSLTQRNRLCACIHYENERIVTGSRNLYINNEHVKNGTLRITEGMQKTFFQ